MRERESVGKEKKTLATKVRFLLFLLFFFFQKQSAPEQTHREK